MHRRPEKTVEESLRRLNLDLEDHGEVAKSIIEDLKGAGWRVEGVYFDRTGAE